MAASNSVNDVSGWLDERLAAASPDLLRAMVKQFAEALMSAEADAAVRRRLRAAVRAAGQLAQRLPAAGLGHPRRHRRAGDPETAVGLVLPGLAAGTPPPGRAGPGLGGGHQLPAGGLHAAGGEAGRPARGHAAVEEPGQRDGQEPRRAGGGVPHPARWTPARTRSCGWTR